MRSIHIVLCVVLVSFVMFLSQAFALDASDGRSAIAWLKNEAADIRVKVSTVNSDGLAPAQARELKTVCKKLLGLADEAEQLAKKWEMFLTGAVSAANKEKMNQSFNLQYLTLQNNISQENRQFSMVSNIMKNKHDTAKNSINNIR